VRLSACLPPGEDIAGRRDLNFDPLRKNPRFQKLVAGGK
jgi:hypothetical protein